MRTACISTSNRQVPGTPIISEQEKQETLLQFVLLVCTTPNSLTSQEETFYTGVTWERTKGYRGHIRTNTCDCYVDLQFIHTYQHQPLVWSLVVDEQTNSVVKSKWCKSPLSLFTTCRDSRNNDESKSQNHTTSGEQQFSYCWLHNKNAHLFLYAHWYFPSKSEPEEQLHLEKLLNCFTCS